MKQEVSTSRRRLEETETTVRKTGTECNIGKLEAFIRGNTIGFARGRR